MRLVSAAAVSALWLISCSKEPNLSSKELNNDSSLKKAWDYANAPERMGLKNGTYEVNFDALLKVKSKVLKPRPWSGGYWPSYLGGISYRWNGIGHWNSDGRIFYDLIPIEEAQNLSQEQLAQLSPTEKIDIYLGDSDYSFTKAERSRTDIMHTKGMTLAERYQDIPHWWGICHAWAPATLLYKNPGPVTLKSPYSGIEVPFGASDVKALLSMFLNNKQSMTFFASRRCNTDIEMMRRQLDLFESFIADPRILDLEFLSAKLEKFRKKTLVNPTPMDESEEDTLAGLYSTLDSLNKAFNAISSDHESRSSLAFLELFQESLPDFALDFRTLALVAKKAERNQKITADELTNLGKAFGNTVQGLRQMAGLLTAWATEEGDNKNLQQEVVRRFSSALQARKKTLSDEYFVASESPECEGIHPGAFHIIVGNMIGKQNKGFVADVTRGAAVWNQAFHGYSWEVIEEKTDNLNESRAEGTVREVKIKADMRYTVEIREDWSRIDANVDASDKHVTYEYWLELDRKNNIIGGHWPTQQEMRPDFLYMRERADFSEGYEVFGEIYEASVKDLPEEGVDTPAPVPDRVPAPVPDRVPAPAPDPVPAPVPDPVPAPVPDPVPAPVDHIRWSVSSSVVHYKVQLSGTFDPERVTGMEVHLLNKKGGIKGRVPVTLDPTIQVFHANFKALKWRNEMKVVAFGVGGEKIDLSGVTNLSYMLD